MGTFIEELPKHCNRFRSSGRETNSWRNSQREYNKGRLQGRIHSLAITALKQLKILWTKRFLKQFKWEDRLNRKRKESSITTQIELSPLSQLISGFDPISVVLSSSLIFQTAAGNRASLKKSSSSSKWPRFQNEAMFMVINIHFRDRGSALGLFLKETLGMLGVS